MAHRWPPSSDDQPCPELAAQRRNLHLQVVLGILQFRPRTFGQGPLANHLAGPLQQRDQHLDRALAQSYLYALDRTDTVTEVGEAPASRSPSWHSC